MAKVQSNKVQAGLRRILQNRAIARALVVLADEAKKEENSDKLQVLVDPDAQRITMNIFKNYISEDDFANLVIFIKEFDRMLFKFRDGKPLTREEVDNLEELEGKGAKGGGAAVLLLSGGGGGAPEKAKTEEDIESQLPVTDDTPEEELGVDVEGDQPDEEEEDALTDDEDEEEEPTAVISNRSKAIASFVSAALANRRR